jgi:tRNA (guanine-N7-)-methyltransferase
MEEHEALTPVDRSIRTYVLRAGRMTDAQRTALDELGPRYIVDAEPGATLQYGKVFGNDAPVIAEIGFGMGKATWQIAAANPGMNYLGFEVHTPGVGRLLSEIASHGLSNIRIVHRDAVEFFETSLLPESLAGLHIFYPDPWPKKRHHKRRLMRPGIVELLVSRLAPGGYLYFVTDVEEYAAWTLDLLSRTESIHNLHEAYAPHQEWRPETKFEAHALHDGRGCFEILFGKG